MGTQKNRQRNGSFAQPKHMFKLMDKKIITIYANFFLLILTYDQKTHVLSIQQMQSQLCSNLLEIVLRTKVSSDRCHLTVQTTVLRLSSVPAWDFVSVYAPLNGTGMLK